MRKSYLSLEQRIHNAEGAQAAETLHARHAYLHARAFGDEEWGQIWSTSDDTSWAHSFGRMRGYDSVYYNNVTTYNCGGQRGYQQMLNILPEIGHFDARSVREVAMHTLATDIVEVADDGLTARGSFLTPGVLFSTLNSNLKARCMTLWERYGSDFVFEKGEWRYLHEQVCPDMGGSFDDTNTAQQKYDALANPKGGPGGPPAGGHAASPLLDPPESGTGLWLQDGGPLHSDYTPVNLVQNSVPFPVPYATMDDDNTYTKKAQHIVSLNIDRFGKIVGAVDIQMPMMGGPGGAQVEWQAEEGEQIAISNAGVNEYLSSPQYTEFSSDRLREDMIIFLPKPYASWSFEDANYGPTSEEYEGFEIDLDAWYQAHS